MGEFSLGMNANISSNWLNSDKNKHKNLISGHQSNHEAEVNSVKKEGAVEKLQRVDCLSFM